MIQPTLAPHLIDYAVNTLWQLPLLAASTWLLIRLCRTIRLRSTPPLDRHPRPRRHAPPPAPRHSDHVRPTAHLTASPRPHHRLTPASQRSFTSPLDLPRSRPPHYSRPALAPGPRHQPSSPDVRLDLLTPPHRLRHHEPRSPRPSLSPILRRSPAHPHPRRPLPQLPLRHPRSRRHLSPHPPPPRSSRPRLRTHRHPPP